MQWYHCRGNSIWWIASCYHTSCYTLYTTPIYTTQLQGEINPEYVEVWKFLSDLFDRPKIVQFQRLQALISTTSRKKNLRQATENKTECYKFINIRNKLLIYPMSLVMDNTGTKYYGTFLQLKNLQNMELKEKIVS